MPVKVIEDDNAQWCSNTRLQLIAYLLAVHDMISSLLIVVTVQLSRHGPILECMHVTFLC